MKPKICCISFEILKFLLFEINNLGITEKIEYQTYALICRYNENLNVSIDICICYLLLFNYILFIFLKMSTASKCLVPNKGYTTKNLCILQIHRNI